LGSASLVLDNGITVAALVVVNARGSALTPGGRYFWAAPFEINGEFGGFGVNPDPDPLCLPATLTTSTDTAIENTTIAVVATDAILDKAQARRMATAAHDGLARALLPAHTPFDGDLVFAIATGGNAIEVDHAALGHFASLCLARAVARGVYDAGDF